LTDAEGRLRGIITTGDLSRHMDGLMSFAAQDIMTPSPITISPDELAEKAIGIMNSKKITCLLVVDPSTPDTLVGLIHIHDCLRVGLG
jgi:arabinose-5-phosphate isomerase